MEDSGDKFEICYKRRLKRFYYITIRGGRRNSHGDRVLLPTTVYRGDTGEEDTDVPYVPSVVERHILSL